MLGNLLIFSLFFVFFASAKIMLFCHYDKDNQKAALICYRKLTIILISIGEGEGDDVVSALGNVGLIAIGRGCP